MRNFRKIASAVMAAVLAASLAAPVSSAATAKTAVVEQELLAGASTSIPKLTFGKISDKAYTGKAIKPAVTVKSGSTKLKSGTDYTVSYKNNTKIGTASVTVTGKGKYTGSKTLTFKIVPAKPTLSVKTDGGKLTFSWKSVKGAGGYQLYYSANGGAYKSLTSTSKTTYSTTKLDAKKNSYTFKLRAYKKVSGKTYYGAWSKEITAGKAGSTTTSNISVEKLSTSGNAGTVKFFGYYDIRNDQKGMEQCTWFESDKFGGKIDYITSWSGEAYYEKLGNLIAADDSPDLVLKDAYQYPGTVSKNMFESLDKQIDLNSALWKDMKPTIDSYAWGGKHYYYPHTLVTSFALNYSKKTIKDNGLEDPYELYKKGEWTWDKWHDMMVQFCEKDKDNMGFYATDTTINGLVLTTGTPLVDVQPKGTIKNNLGSKNVARAMEFLETLYRDGVAYKMQLGEWVPPQTFAINSDKLLFLVMEPEWTYTAATEQIQNPQGIDNDIFGTVSDFAFVPFPKDPKADKYYQGVDTFGYVVPKGAKNIKGAVEFINLNRAYELDAKIQKQVKKDHLSPETVYYTAGKYQGKQRWQITWGEKEYNMLQDLRDPSKFTFVYEDVYGFGSDLTLTIGDVVYNAMYDGASWSNNSANLSQVVDTYADYYSSMLRN